MTSLSLNTFILNMINLQDNQLDWCNADSENSDIIELLLKCVKEISPLLLKVVMTDDGMHNAMYDVGVTILGITDNTGWTATKAVLVDIKHMLCYCHVDIYIYSPLQEQHGPLLTTIEVI